MRAIGLLVVFMLMAIVPSSMAQKPVESCSRECLATDPDVNPKTPLSEPPVNVVMYGHFEDILGTAPLNLIPPDPTHEPDLKGAFPLPTVDTNTCPPSVPSCADVHFQNSQFGMHFCPGRIEFLMDGTWRHLCHSLGPAAPIEGSGPIVLYFYLSAEAGPSTATGDRDLGVGAMPNVRVTGAVQRSEADVQTNSFRMETFAWGTSEDTNVVNLPGEPPVYEFRVEMNPVSAGSEWTMAVPPERNLVVTIHVEQIVTDDGSVRATQGELRVHTGARYPPRIVMAVRNPLINSAVTTTFDSDPFARFVVLSPFGGYDVPVSSITAALVGPDNTTAPSAALQLVQTSRHSEHDSVHKPVNVTWRIHDELIPGSAAAYKLRVTATNLQGTFTVTEELELNVVDFNPRPKTPAPNVFVVLSILALATLAARVRSANR